MNVLVACEFSGIVRDAFRAKGHNAWSCDLLPCEADARWHYQGDFRRLFGQFMARHRPEGMPTPDRWDMIITHTPCTRLTNSGVRWLHKPPSGKTLPQMWREFDEGVVLFKWLEGKAPKLCRENPIPHKYARAEIGMYNQLIQPWMFGHKEMKATCFWLDGLPKLVPTDIVGPPPIDKADRKAWQVVHRASPGPNRWKERSRTRKGIADAMAEQWG